MSDTSDGSTANVDARIAVLEERTKPKVRTILDRIKDWSGVLTFVIAVAYTYPLGVWDRFVVTAQQQRAKEVSDLRSIILALSQTDAESLRALASVSDPTLQLQLGAASNGRKASLLAPNMQLIEKHYEELTGGELELLGFYVNQSGDQGVLASKMLEKSADKMIRAKNVIGAADVLRIQAQMYSPFGSIPDISKSRQFLQKSINLLIGADPLKGYPNATALVMDWMYMEGSAGSWPCAQLLGNWLIAQNQFVAPAFAEQIQKQINQAAAYRNATKAPWLSPTGQGPEQCPSTVIPWNVVGWPWTSKVLSGPFRNIGSTASAN